MIFLLENCHNFLSSRYQKTLTFLNKWERNHLQHFRILEMIIRLWCYIKIGMKVIKYFSKKKLVKNRNSTSIYFSIRMILGLHSFWTTLGRSRSCHMSLRSSSKLLSQCLVDAKACRSAALTQTWAPSRASVVNEH